MKKLLALILAVTMVSATLNLSEAQSAALPKNIRVVEAEAFYGDESIETVFLPYGTERIESRAFAGSGVQIIYIPQTVSYIAEDAFEGAEEYIVIGSPADTYAEKYASDHNLAWRDAGYRYSTDKYLAAQDLLNSTEPAGENVVSLEGIESSLIDETLFDDDTAQIISRYNAMEEESEILLANYNGTVNDVFSQIENFSPLMENEQIDYTDDGLLYSGNGFTYYVSSAGADEIGTDAEIVSTAASEDGTMVMEVTSGGKLYTVTGNMDGISVSKGGARQNSGSGSGAFVARFEGISYGESSNFEEISSIVLAQVYNFKNLLDVLIWQVDDALEEAGAYADLKYSQWKTAENLMRNPGKISDEGMEALSRGCLMAEANYKIARAAVKAWERSAAALKVVSPGATIKSIIEDISQIKKLDEYEKHGHPLPGESEDEQKAELVSFMQENIRNARTAYTANLLNSALGLIDEIKTAVSLILSLTGVGTAPAWLGNLVIGFGLNKARTMLVSFIAGLVLGTSAEFCFQKVEETDKLLHSALTGYIRNGDIPLENVKVRCGSSITYSDSKGFYSIYVPDGPQILYFSKDGYRPNEAHIQKNPNYTTLDWSLIKSARMNTGANKMYDGVNCHIIPQVSRVYTFTCRISTYEEVFPRLMFQYYNPDGYGGGYLGWTEGRDNSRSSEGISIITGTMPNGSSYTYVYDTDMENDYKYPNKYELTVNLFLEKGRVYDVHLMCGPLSSAVVNMQ